MFEEIDITQWFSKLHNVHMYQNNTWYPTNMYNFMLCIIIHQLKINLIIKKLKKAQH
jgi:hypothetical protein